MKHLPDLMNDWRRLQHAAEGDPEIDALDYIEAVILTHQPTTLPEALDLIEVIREVTIGGGRTDGLDVDALSNLRRALPELALPTVRYHAAQPAA